MADTESRLTSGPSHDIGVCSCGRRHVDFYCRTDKQLICKLCKSDHHIECDSRLIYTLTDGIYESKDLYKTVRELNSIKSAFLQFESSETLQTVRRTQERQNAIASTKRFRIDREKTQLERELESKITNFQHEITSERLDGRRDSGKMVKNIDYYLDLLSRYRQEGQAKQLFILLYKLHGIIPIFLDNLSSLYDNQRHDLINSQIKGTLLRYHKSDNPGNVKVTRSRYNPDGVSPRGLPRSGIDQKRVSPTRPVHSSQTFRVLHDNDHKSNSCQPTSLHRDNARVASITETSTNRSRSSITRYVTTASFDEKSLSGVQTQFLKMNTNSLTEKRLSTMKVTNDGRILLLDYHNQMLELYSLNKTFLFGLKLFRSVWDFDFTNDYEILVTCPYDGALQYVQFSDEDLLFQTSSISTEKGCRAICAFPTRLFVSFTGDDPCIRYMSRDGVTYRTINPILNDTIGLVEPLFIHVSRDRNYMFISDYTMQRVTILNARGDIVKSHDTFPGSPMAMATDRDGNVLVSIAGTDEILMISRDGNRSRTLVKKSEIGGQPSAVAFRPESKLLLVAVDKDALVKMFHII